MTKKGETVGKSRIELFFVEMGNKQSAKAIQPKDPIDKHNAKAHMVPNTLLIWLDSNIDESAPNYQNTIGQLRGAMNSVKVFTEIDACVKYLSSISNSKVFMVISGGLGEKIVPQIHDLDQVDTIFIFCSNRAYHEKWAKNWSKIDRIFTEITPICAALKTITQKSEQDSTPMSFFDPVAHSSKDEIEPSFMYTTILKEILLTIDFKKQHIHEYIKYCRKIAKEPSELKNINDFEREYNKKLAIRWYTMDCFLYRMLNRALRQLDADIIITMGFFISDLHQQIDELHKEQLVAGDFNRSFIVYRGLRMKKIAFSKIEQTKGGLLSFNNFLSTSKKREVAMEFIIDDGSDLDSVGVLFVMTIRPDQSTTPFASISHVSRFRKEDEILFSMHSVFRIIDINSQDDDPNVFIVNLTLTADNDKDLQSLLQRIRDESFPDSEGWYRLGEMLRKMGHFEKAQHIYEMLLDQENDESVQASIYQQLGIMKYEQGQYKEAVGFYEKNLEINQKILSSEDPQLAVLYNNIGAVCDGIGNYTTALAYYKKALDNQQQSLNADHPDLAMSYNNIGWTYKNMHRYSEALSSYEKAVAIQQKSLHTNHPELGMSYNNIGEVYCHMNDNQAALSFHDKAQTIWQKSLPTDHPYFAESYNNVGLVYEKMNDLSKATEFFEKAVSIAQNSSSASHPELQKWISNRDRVKTKL